MKAETLRDMSYEELLSQQALLQKEIFELRLKKARGETPKAGEQRAKRRDLARVLTVLGEYKAAMQVVDNDEDAALKALRLHKWDAIATVADLEADKAGKQSGQSASVVKLALHLTVSRQGKNDLPRACNLIKGAELIARTTDAGKVLVELAKLNREGLESAAEFRAAMENALTQAQSGVAKVVVRGVLADNRYNLERSVVGVQTVLKLAQDGAVEAPVALMALQAASGNAELALKRLKKQAKVAKVAKA